MAAGLAANHTLFGSGHWYFYTVFGHGNFTFLNCEQL